MKKYKYKDKIYCKEDLSKEIDNYGGNLHDLFEVLRSNYLACETTIYHDPCPNSIDDCYTTIEEYVENCCEELLVEEDINGTTRI